MTHRQPFNFYIASCDENGGILSYKFSDDEIKIVDKINLDRPMYMAFESDKMHVILRDPESKEESGLVTLVNKNGKLEKTGKCLSTKGCVACHLCVLDGVVYCVNYLSGSIIKMPDKVVCHSGKGVNSVRQEMAHTHYIESFDGNFLLSCDLGTDEIYTYDRDLNEISRVKIPEGHGPRHLAFYDNMVYCVNELKSTISVLDYNGGRLVLKETVDILPDDFNGENTAAAIRIKNGFIYASNRGHNSISVLKPDEDGLKLIKTVDCGGEGPRDFNIFDDVLICTNEDSNNVTFFEIKKGIPEKLDFEIKVKSPLCVI